MRYRFASCLAFLFALNLVGGGTAPGKEAKHKEHVAQGSFLRGEIFQVVGSKVHNTRVHGNVKVNVQVCGKAWRLKKQHLTMF